MSEPSFATAGGGAALRRPFGADEGAHPSDAGDDAGHNRRHSGETPACRSGLRCARASAAAAAAGTGAGADAGRELRPRSGVRRSRGAEEGCSRPGRPGGWRRQQEGRRGGATSRWGAQQRGHGDEGSSQEGALYNNFYNFLVIGRFFRGCCLLAACRLAAAPRLNVVGVVDDDAAGAAAQPTRFRRHRHRTITAAFRPPPGAGWLRSTRTPFQPPKHSGRPLLPPRAQRQQAPPFALHRLRGGRRQPPPPPPAGGLVTSRHESSARSARRREVVASSPLPQDNLYPYTTSPEETTEEK